MRLLKNKKGQNILEYTLLIAAIVAALVALQIYVKRAVQGKLKQGSDQIGEQFTTAQTNTIQTISQSARQEKTVVDITNGLGTEWSRSEIADSGKAFVPGAAKAGAYQGYEVNKTDYVDATAGGGALGSHGTFQSGKISDVKLFEDD